MPSSIKKIVFYAIAFVILTLFYAHISSQIRPNSDAVSGLLAGKDMANGNWTLGGWHLSTVSFYFTDIIWYGLASKSFGYGAYQAYLIPAIMYSMVTLMTFYLSRENAGSLWAIAFCVAIPSGFAAFNTLIAVIHVGTYVCMLVCFIMIERYTKTDSLLSIIIYTLSLTLACFSDDIIKLIILTPILISSIYFFAKEKRSVYIIILFASLLAYVASKMMVRYARSNGWFILPGIPAPTFVAFDDIGNNLYLFTKGFLLYSGAFFFGKSPSDITAILSVFCFIILTILIIVCALSIKEIFTTSILNMTICLACLVMVPAYLVSNRPIDVWTIRYIVSFFILAPVVIGRSSLSKGWRFCMLGAVVIAVLVSSVVVSEKKDISSDIINQLKLAIRENHLENGYASFWFASSVSIDGDISVAPLNVNRDLNILACNRWLSKAEWYQRGGNFIITDDNLMREIIIKSFGTPSKVINVGDKQIFVYEKNITFSCD